MVFHQILVVHAAGSVTVDGTGAGAATQPATVVSPLLLNRLLNRLPIWAGNVGRLVTFGTDYNVELDMLALSKAAEPRHDDG